MLKNDLQSESMSHQAIDHRVKLIVNKGVYSLEVTFKGMKIGNLTGYLGELSYFVDGYQRDLTGRPVGKTEKAEVCPTLQMSQASPCQTLMAAITHRC
ncbi:hypothetical protein [Streptococcus equi]|uniref:hypothetical protein n=1 Tax=Streptococcus equi TaxID=1336 RepID=UPI001E2C4F9A|nr:hypothetical protein [Streptococcus equi]